MNSQVAVTSPIGRRSTTVYDLAGQVTASVDRRRHRTAPATEARGRQPARRLC
ncbi:MAG: hypothetical protein ACK5XS_10975 [Armatimonadota bacterium]|nr:hypothetical protein [Fimbriimonadaceae bacterium]MCZ8139515.1 hypothetical protein [Fimbriimonadaceae bacterium]